MEKMIGICGITCTDCPAYIATQKNDDDERKKVAELWSTDEYHLKPEDINCYGCFSDKSKVISFAHDCEVRNCGLEKDLKSCAHCGEYPCEKLEKIIGKVPEAKATLEEMRKSI